MSSARNTPTYYRSGLGMKDVIASEVAKDYHSEIVTRLIEEGREMTIGDLTFVLAKEFGFCYGVDKAVDMAYEARAKFPDRRIFLTYEIIHNPRVNARLKEMGIRFLSGSQGADAAIDEITAEDVVLLPAFGVAADYLETLRAKGCVLVDTTCGSVVHVWKRVERYAKDSFTALVHGKALHAETLATVSQAHKLGGHTIVVRDKGEAELVCQVIRGEREPEAVFELPGHAFSKGFDPRAHLSRIGVANQTTMLASESLEIAALVSKALEDRYGAEHREEHFRSFDTICSATQERQDAIVEMVADSRLDFMLVIGGYNSSNTGHLLEIALKSVPAYHICDASELISKRTIRHKPAGKNDTIESEDWIPEGPIRIGLTAGASTPHRAIGETIERMVKLREEKS